jgi:hypothetical protein
VVLTGGFAFAAQSAAEGAAKDNKPPVTVTQTVFETVTQSVAPVTVTVTASPTRVAKAPETKFADGTFEVGFDVAAGRYRTTGPVAAGASCVWQRTRPDGGVIDGGTVLGPITVTVRAGELVHSTGCAPWAKIG